MKRSTLPLIALVLALLGPSVATAGAPSVEVAGDRIELGDLNPTVPRELMHLDVGPSPNPGKATVVSREAIRAALTRAGADSRLADGLPARTQVERTARLITKDELEKYVVAEMRRRLPVGVDVRTIVGLRDVSIPNETPEVEVRVPRLRRASTGTIVVKTGKRVWATLTATINLSGQPMTPVLRRDMPRQSVIGDGDLEMKATDYSKLPHRAALRKEELVGKELSQATRAGTTLQRTAVKTPPVIKRGREIMLVATGSGVRVAQRATAKEDGLIGDWIRVQPGAGGRVLRAEVVSANEARITIGGTSP